ncbi:uncharacterized protein LOC124816130 isoform X1 [Hydra vulgaris]|uniref:uncharacterized protein LOC124816130 isoform X1 n=1 Tax=Hydra vulgaris TaxID=6087 RepID=UPI0032EA7948
MHELNISDADFHENITSNTSLVDVVLSKEDIYQNNNQTCSQSVDAEMRTNGVTSKRLIKDVDDDNNNDIDMNNNAILDKNKITLFNKLRKRFYNEKPIQNKRIKSLIKTTLKNGGETDVDFSSSQSVSELSSSPPVKKPCNETPIDKPSIFSLLSEKNTDEMVLQLDAVLQQEWCKKKILT